MSSAGGTTLVVSLAVGIPVLVASILVLVFSLVGRMRARERAALDQEGVVLDSGPQWITIRYRNFRAPGIYRGVGITKTRGSLVLTAGFGNRRIEKPFRGAAMMKVLAEQIVAAKSGS